MIERPNRLVSFLFGAAILWLVVGSALALLAAVQLAWFVALPASLSFGRVAPAAANVLIYGWVGSAALGASFWFLARPASILSVVAAVFLQVGVFIGAVGLILGQGNAIFLLDFPLYAAVCIFIAAVCLTVSACSCLPQPRFASTWYLATALLVFPWLYANGYAFLVWHPVPGAAQGPIATWFVGGIVNLWLAPIALASAYFLIPAILRRRLISYNLARPAFWSFLAVGAWAGLGQLLGGPIPSWMSATGAFAGQLLLIPVLFITISFFSTLSGMPSALRESFPLRFVLLGSIGFLAAYGLGTILSLPALNGVFHFSDLALAQSVLIVAGFVTPALLGLIAYGKGSAKGPLLAWQFWLLVIAVALTTVCFALGGVIQSFAQADPGLDFMASVTYVRPFRLLAALGVCVFLISTLLFAVWFFRRAKP